MPGVILIRSLLLNTLLLASCGQGADARSVAGTVVTDADLALAEGPAARAALVDELLLLRHAKDTGLIKDPVLQAALHRSERRLVAQRVIDDINKDVAVEATLRALYAERKPGLTQTQLHLAHILLPRDVDGDTIRARLRAGEAFEDVARAVSADGATATVGGAMPPVVASLVEPAFFAAAEVLAPGTWSDVVIVGEQRHIIKALAAAERITPTFEEVRGALQAELLRTRRTELLQQLRERYEVKSGDL